MIDYENIPWEKQCDFCLKAINTTYCNETKRVIEEDYVIPAMEGKKCTWSLDFSTSEVSINY